MINILLTIVLVIASIVLIGSVIGQSGKSAGMSGSIAGGAEQLFGKQKGRALDQLLDKVTKVAAVLFMLCAIILTALQ